MVNDSGRHRLLHYINYFRSLSSCFGDYKNALHYIYHRDKAHETLPAYFAPVVLWLPALIFSEYNATPHYIHLTD